MDSFLMLIISTALLFYGFKQAEERGYAPKPAPFWVYILAFVALSGAGLLIWLITR